MLRTLTLPGIGVLMVCLFSASTNGGESGPARLEFNGGEVVYDLSIQESEATALGQLLVEMEYFDGVSKTVHLVRSDNTIQIRFCLRKDAWDTPEIQDAFASVQTLLSMHAFDNQPVEIHLCDKMMNSEYVIPAPVESPLAGTARLEFNGGEVFYTDAVQESEAIALGQFLVDDMEFFDGDRKSVHLDRIDSTIQVRFCVYEGAWNEPDIQGAFSDIRTLLSLHVFDVEPVEVHLCNDMMATQYVIPAPEESPLAGTTDGIDKI